MKKVEKDMPHVAPMSPPTFPHWDMRAAGATPDRPRNEEMLDAGGPHSGVSVDVEVMVDVDVRVEVGVCVEVRVEVEV